MEGPRTTIHLVETSVEAVCVALGLLDEGRALAATFPVMRLPAPATAPDTEGAALRVSAQGGVVRVLVEGDGTLSVERLSRQLGCAALVSAGRAGALPRQRALFHGGSLIWEECWSHAPVRNVGGLRCPALGIDLRDTRGETAADALEAAWALIDAHVALTVGAARAQRLSDAEVAEWEDVAT